MKGGGNRVYIIVGTHNFAYPRGTQDQEIIEQYVKILLLISSFLDDNHLLPLKSGNIWFVLDKEGINPSNDFFSLNNLFQDQDIRSLLFSVIERMEELENVVGIKEILCEEIKLCPEPQFLPHKSELKKDYERVLALWLAKEGEEENKRCVLVFCGNLEEPQKIIFSAEAIELEGKKQFKEKLPFKIYGQVFNLSNPLEIGRFLSSSTLISLSSLFFAIICEFAGRSNKPLSLGEIELSYNFHPEFLPSAKNLGFLNEETKMEKLVRTCVDALNEERNDQVHAIRENKGGSTRALIRKFDGAKALRRNLDKFYRLHYWKKGKRVEFAIVVPHNEDRIPF